MLGKNARDQPMRRREFIATIGIAAVACPLAARAQQVGRIWRVGFLGAATAAKYAKLVDAFRAGLRDFAYIEGKNLAIEFRWAEGNTARLPELAAQLVKLNIDCLVTHGTPGTAAAKKASTTVPIVMAVSGDAVATGLIKSLAQPGGNVTGTTFFGPELAAKRLEFPRRHSRRDQVGGARQSRQSREWPGAQGNGTHSGNIENQPAAVRGARRR
jgi:putative tryptophan/tyrosine transport system substrate-binding protein